MYIFIYMYTHIYTSNIYTYIHINLVKGNLFNKKNNKTLLDIKIHIFYK